MFVLEPLLETQIGLHLIPRGQARFDAYIAVTAGAATHAADLKHPHLVAMNPMGKDHVLRMLQTYLDFEAETVVERILDELNQRLPLERIVLVGLVALDDLMGGWTNTHFDDFGFRFKALPDSGGALALIVPLWTTRTPSLEELTITTRESAFRVAYQTHHGIPRTLREMMRQEGFAARFAGRRLRLETADLEYSRAAMREYLNSTHAPTQFACLYGDRAAASVGYPPLGFSIRAGFQIGLAWALESRHTPESMLEKTV